MFSSMSTKTSISIKDHQRQNPEVGKNKGKQKPEVQFIRKNTLSLLERGL